MRSNAAMTLRAIAAMAFAAACAAAGAEGARFVPQVGHSFRASAFELSRDGRRAFSASSDGTVKIWDAATWDLERTLYGQGGSIPEGLDDSRGGASPPGITLRISPQAYFYREAQAATTRRFLDGRHWIYSLAFSPDGRRLAVGSGHCGEDGDRTVKEWDVASAAIEAVHRGGGGNVRAATYSRDGRIISIDEEGSCLAWRAGSSDPAEKVYGQRSFCESISISADGRWALTGKDMYTVLLLDVDKREIAKTFSPQENYVRCAVLSPDGKSILTGSDNGEIALRDTGANPFVRRLRGQKGEIFCAAFLPSGDRALTGSQDGSVFLWDLAGGRILSRLEGAAGQVFSLAVSPDGSLAAAGDTSGRVTLWDLRSPSAPGLPLGGERTFVRALAFSPDGSRLAVGSTEGILQVWEARSRSLLYSAFGDEAGDWVAWTPEGFFRGSDWGIFAYARIFVGQRALSPAAACGAFLRPDLVAAKATGKDVSAQSKAIDVSALLGE
jgi:WD40 repeat protein